MKPTVHRYWKYGAIVLALGLVGNSLEIRKIKKALQGIYRYDVKVKVVDSLTGKPLDSISIGAPVVSTTDLFQQIFGVSVESDGVVDISGIGYEPRQWTLGRNGYKGATIIVDDETPRSLVVRLEPKAGQAGTPDGDKPPN